MLVRASLGTLIKLGLFNDALLDEPRTAYFLQYSANGCLAKCGFCSQSRVSKNDKDQLGRVSWPSVELSDIIRNWKECFDRICFQSVLKRGFIKEVFAFVREIRDVTKAPLSVAVTPVPREFLTQLKKMGVDQLGVGLDTATEELFRKWNKPYTWDLYWKFIREAVEVFGRGNVYVHIIAGLGEKFEDIVSIAKKIYSIGGEIALFNYLEVGKRKSIDVRYYRLIQLSLDLLKENKNPYDYLEPGSLKFRRKPDVDVFKALLTKGCPGCNRPFYTDFPSYPVYNFSSEKILNAYRDNVLSELKDIGVEV